MDGALVNQWAKTKGAGEPQWHPLILHMLDVAACADAILAREPESTKLRLTAVFGLEWSAAHPWLLLLVGCHDLGKACPGFQCKWRNLSGLDAGRNPNTDVNHAFVSQVALTELLQRCHWPRRLAEMAADAAGCHHGARAKPTTLEDLEGDRRALGSQEWKDVRAGLFDRMLATLNAEKTPAKQRLSGPDFMLLAGLTSFSDWIGSNEDWFPFGHPSDCADLPIWFKKRRKCAEQALDQIGWEERTPLATQRRSFEQVFARVPRPLQLAVEDTLISLKNPSVMLVEAPMGEGKTEAAFYAHLELQRRFGHRGLYIALPTKATGNAMFDRTLQFLRAQGRERPVDLQLLHGGAAISEPFQSLRFSSVHDPATGGEVRAAEWFTNKKRALLSEYGVGTVDQILVPILPVRHNFVRLWGLANRVVVFDEIHAYDAYTGTLIIQLVHWLAALGSSVVLLSATLPPSFRRRLAEAVRSGMPDHECSYPRLSIFSPGDQAVQRGFGADPARSIAVQIRGIATDLATMHAALQVSVAKGGLALALVNTVQRAQELYRLFPEGAPVDHGGQRIGKRLADGTEVYLFHARFPAMERQRREDHALEKFGPNGRREGRKILIATQVAEQSLDLDFDLLATDLAPIDLLLQRAGRLWRHARQERPLSEATVVVAGLAGDEPPSFGAPLWWGTVYREDLLLRTWVLLKSRWELRLPADIDALVQTVYEDEVVIPEFLRARLETVTTCIGEKIRAEFGQANQTIIGLPDDDSWNDPARFVLYDEDEPGVHRTLLAQTRLGEDSIVVLPLWADDGFTPQTRPDQHVAKEWYLRGMGLARFGVVKVLRTQGVPPGWKQSPLLRNCYPLLLDEKNRWTEDARVFLDRDLGLVYGNKEDV